MIDDDIQAWIDTLPAEGNCAIKVYNTPYVAYLRDRIARQRGFEYLSSLSFIIPGDDSMDNNFDKKVYISPILHDYVGNGYN